MKLAMFRNIFFALLVTICISNDATCQQFPHQVQQFFQSYIVKPLEDTFNKRAEEVSGVINHLINSSSSSSSSSNSSGNTNETPSSQVPDDISLTTTNSSSNSNDRLLNIIRNGTIQLIESLLPAEKENNATAQENPSSTISSLVSEPESSSTSTTQPNLIEVRSSKSAPLVTLPLEQVQTIKGLCPDLTAMPDEKVQSEQWRYYEPRNQCFRLNRRGPCGSGMILYPQDVGSIYGICDCKPIDDKRMAIYANETNSCYPIFSQGNCKENEWIDLTRSGDVVCTTNPCAENGNNFVLLNDTCVEIGKATTHCESEEVVGFRRNRRSPLCVIRPGGLPTYGTVQTGPAPCPPGSYQAIHGKCHVADWEFGDED